MSDDNEPYQIETNDVDNRPSFMARWRMKQQLKLSLKEQNPKREKKPSKPKNKEKGSSIWGAFSSLITVCLVLVLLVAGGWIGVKQMFEVKNGQKIELIFKVETGDNLGRIAQRLEEDELISSQDLYKFLVSWEGNDTRLKAGEYKIPANVSMREIMNIFVGGQSIQYKITFAEGLSTAQIIHKIKIAPLLSGKVTSTPVEGSLMPETYVFASGTDRNLIIKQMQNAQVKFLTGLWETRADDLPLKSIEEVVIMASIVEKETGVAKERPEVAAVFINRIKQKMKLQSDPTIIYGITKGVFKLDRSLRKSEIKGKTEYNTYVIKGLPPTPIANPGRASILAVLNPAKVDYLFFVADGTGGHVFAKTYKQHQKNVKKWRAIEKNNNN